MKRRKLLIILILIAGITFFKATAQIYTPPPQEEKILDKIKFYKNLRYGAIPDSTTSTNSDRILDLYLLNDSTNKKELPLFLFIHGGGFAGGDKALTDFCTKIANRGYAVASINYRLTLKNNKVPDAGCASNMAKGLPVEGKFHPLLQKAIKDASDDAAMALQWLSKNASLYNLNTNEVFVCGGSAGAMTALNLAYVSKSAHPKIKAVINFWGGLENVQLIKKNAPPLLTYHGDKDDIIHVDYAHALHKKVKQLGLKQSKLVVLKDKGHALYKYITDNKIDEIINFFSKLTLNIKLPYNMLFDVI